MTHHRFCITVTWADIDLLEVEVSVRFKAWAAADRMYVSRNELQAFAISLVAIAEGGNTAVLEAGQPDLGFASARVYEYGGARHLAMDLRVGHGGGDRVGQPDFPRELRISLPVERGQLSSFASEIHSAVLAETGTATLALPPEWP